MKFNVGDSAEITKKIESAGDGYLSWAEVAEENYERALDRGDQALAASYLREVGHSLVANYLTPTTVEILEEDIGHDLLAQHLYVPVEGAVASRIRAQRAGRVTE